MNIKKEEQLLKDTGRLSTHPHIHCVKCQAKTTAFGTNLAGKIERAGSLGDLLSTFECRSCRNAGKPQRLPKAPKRKRKDSKAYRKTQLLAEPPKMVFSERKPIVLIDNPDYTAELTQHSCVRPDVFLDSQRSCDFCSLYEICKAPNRRLTSQGWQAGKKLAA